MYLTFAENLDILVQIVNAKFENEKGKDNRFTPVQKNYSMLLSTYNGE